MNDLILEICNLVRLSEIEKIDKKLIIRKIIDLMNNRYYSNGWNSKISFRAYYSIYHDMIIKYLPSFDENYGKEIEEIMTIMDVFK